MHFYHYLSILRTTFAFYLNKSITYISKSVTPSETKVQAKSNHHHLHIPLGGTTINWMWWSTDIIIKKILFKFNRCDVSLIWYENIHLLPLRFEKRDIYYNPVSFVMKYSQYQWMKNIHPDRPFVIQCENTNL